MLTWFMDPIHWFGEGGIFPSAQHISYSAVALAIAFIIAFPVGCYTGHTGKGEGLLIGTTNALRSLPSFGLIILLVILLSGEFESDMAFILPCILVLVALRSRRLRWVCMRVFARSIPMSLMPLAAWG